MVIGPNNHLYIGGDFTNIGKYSGGAVPFDINTHQVREQFPKFYGYVYAIVPDNQGGWYIGGDFNRVGNFQRNNLAHILPNGNVDPNFAPNINGGVYSLAISSSSLYVGGFLILLIIIDLIIILLLLVFKKFNFRQILLML